VKKFSASMKPEGSVPCLQKPVLGPYPETVEYIPHTTSVSHIVIVSSHLHLDFQSGFIP
jgi:hypothetical protein